MLKARTSVSSSSSSSSADAATSEANVETSATIARIQTQFPTATANFIGGAEPRFVIDGLRYVSVSDLQTLRSVVQPAFAGAVECVCNLNAGTISISRLLPATATLPALDESKLVVDFREYLGLVRACEGNAQRQRVLASLTKLACRVFGPDVQLRLMPCDETNKVFVRGPRLDNLTLSQMEAIVDELRADKDPRAFDVALAHFEDKAFMVSIRCAERLVKMQKKKKRGREPEYSDDDDGDDDDEDAPERKRPRIREATVTRPPAPVLGALGSLTEG